MTKRGAISFVFDDGYEHIYQDVLPILESAHIPAVVSVTLEGKSFGDSTHVPRRPWQEWLEIKSRGHEIASHTVSHRDLKAQSNPELEIELGHSAEALGASTIVYPGGGISDEIMEISRKYYTAGRGIIHGYEGLVPEHPMQLHTLNYRSDNFSVLKANLYALMAFLKNQWVIETYHVVSNSEPDIHHCVKLTDFKRHVDFVKLLPIHATTISGLINDSKKL